MANSEGKKMRTAPSEQPTVAEIKEWYSKNKSRIEDYAKAKEALILKDVTKSTTKTISTFDKETLRTYLQNIGSNEKNLRNLARYLYYRSHVYARLISFYANMFCLYARTVVPVYNPSEDNNKDEVLKSYYETLKVLETMDLQREMVNVYTVCLLEDIFYGIVIYDETGMIILRQDPDYCSISGKYLTGDFSYSINMSSYRNKRDIIEAIGEPLSSMYRAYESTGEKWQPVPDENCLCLKFRADDWEIIVPPGIGLFNSLINLSDLEDIEAVADAQQIYKMIWLKLKTIGNNMDDWEISPDLVISYFNKMISEALPDYVSAAVVPGDLETIDFDNDNATDTRKVATATETVLNTAGGAEILNGATISGTTAFNGAEIANTEYSISTLLPQTQSWVNRFLSYHVGTPAKVKFFPVSVYTIENFRKNLLTAAQNGLPTKMAYNSTLGFSELDTLSLNYLEEDVLGLSDKLRPLSTSYTQSGAGDDGRPTLDDVDLTDDADASREKRDRQ